MRILSKCPYCEKINKCQTDMALGCNKKVVVTCDLNEGGCDRDYVASATLRIECESLKIEGEG